MIYLQLFWSFFQVSLFSVGGGYAALPLIQSQIVDTHGWLTMAEFSDLITIAEMTPGPIAINGATFVGIRCAGLPGAAIATLGYILPSCILVSVLALVYKKYRSLSLMRGVLASLRPAVVALIASAGLTVLREALFGSAALALQNVDWLSAICFVGAFLLIRFKKWNPILTMALCGGVYAAAHLLIPA